jgi:hypothetical protein
MVRTHARSPARALLVAVASAALLSASAGQEPPRLPFNPFAASSDGDWSTYIVSIGSGTETLSRQVVTWRVVSAGDDGVVSRVDTRTYKEHEAQGTPVKFARREPPSVEAFFRIPVPTTGVGDVVVSDDQRVAAGRSFACQRLTFEAMARGRRAEAIVWLAREVRGSGLVAARIEVRGEGSGVTTIQYELVGFGTKDKVELGRKGQEVDLESPSGKAPR